MFVMLLCSLIIGFEDPVLGNCGISTLYVGLRSLDVSLPNYEQFLKGIPKNEGIPGFYSLEELQAIGQQFLPVARPAKVDLEFALANFHRAVFVLNWSGHFVILGPKEEQGILILDPPAEYYVSPHFVRHAWDGNCLILSHERFDLPEPTIMSARWSFFSILTYLVGLIAIVFAGATIVRRRWR